METYIYDKSSKTYIRLINTKFRIMIPTVEEEQLESERYIKGV